MKFWLYFIGLIIICFLSCQSKKENSIPDTLKPNNFEIRRGVNVSHWLSQSDSRGEARKNYIQSRDFVKIAQLGFDHVRLPVDEEQLWDEKGNKNKEVFKLLHNAVSWSVNNGLRLVVDLHILRSHHFNTDNKRLWTDTTAQQQFWNIWEELSEELDQYSIDSVAYELLNEAVAENPEDWNKLIAKGIETIRKKEPQRTIIVGSNMWQQVHTFPSLKIPENDSNLILSFHYYDPFLFTHHKAPWTGTISEYTGKVKYPGYTVDTTIYDSFNQELVRALKNYNRNYSKAYMENHIMIAVKVAKEYKLPLYCGEFGCYPTTSVEARAKLYSDYVSIFNKNDIAWCHWNYKNDFPLVDKETLEPITELTSVLLENRE